jgi:hypothetical protein
VSARLNLAQSIMKKLVIILLFFGIVLLLSRCAGSQTTPVAPINYIVENERTINKPFEELWVETINLFATYNWSIKNLDKSSGFIASDYKLVEGNPNDYLYCPPGRIKMTLGKMERVDHGGNFNVLLTKVSQDSTRVKINIFYDCKEIQYQNSSRGYFVNSTYKVQCKSKGIVEKAFLDYLEIKK